MRTSASAIIAWCISPEFEKDQEGKEARRQKSITIREIARRKMDGRDIGKTKQKNRKVEIEKKTVRRKIGGKGREKAFWHFARSEEGQSGGDWGPGHCPLWAIVAKWGLSEQWLISITAALGGMAGGWGGLGGPEARQEMRVPSLFAASLCASIYVPACIYLLKCATMCLYVPISIQMYFALWHLSISSLCTPQRLSGFPEDQLGSWVK